KEKISFIVICHKNICEAIVIIVGDGYTHSFTNVFVYPAGCRDISKSTITVVTIKEIWKSLIECRRTSKSPTRISAKLVGGKRPIQVIDDEQIQEPIVVEVEPRGRDGPRLFPRNRDARHTCFLSYVTESPVAIVVVEKIAIHASYIEIR